MAALLSAPTLSASQFAEFMDAAPLYQCPRSATPTMCMSHTRERSLSASTASGSGGLHRDSSSGLGLARMATRRDRGARESRESRDWLDWRRRDHSHSGASGSGSGARRSFQLSALRPRLRRAESDGEDRPRHPGPPRKLHSRSMSPARAKSARSALSSHFSDSHSAGSHGSPLRKVEHKLELAPDAASGGGRSCCASPQPLPCLESCTGPPSPNVPTFASSTTTTLINQERDWEEEPDDGIIWVVPRSRRGSRASSYAPAKPKAWLVAQHITPEPEPVHELHGLRRMSGAPAPAAPAVPSKSRVRIERITNWGLPHGARRDDEHVWQRLSAMWWRRKST